jgi:predicted  nucleic acid-binding Zn-ribbon protein
MNDERFVNDVISKSVGQLASKIGNQAADLALAQSQIEILQEQLTRTQKELFELKQKYEAVEAEPIVEPVETE